MCFAFWVPCFDVRCNFRMNTMFGSSLSPVVCKTGGSCLVCVRMVVFNTGRVVLFFCLSSSCVSYVASFSELSILIAPSVFSNVCLRLTVIKGCNQVAPPLKKEK
jgi:hypothetical protein